MKLYNPALKLIPGPGSTIKTWSRQYRPTIELFPKETEYGAATRLWRDFKGFVLFSGLFRRDKLLWLGSWLFHAALTVLFLIHLKWIIPLQIWFGEANLHLIGRASGWVLLVCGFGLLVRRLIVTRVRQITSSADYVSELLLATTVVTGLWVGYDRPEAEEVSRYLASLLTLSPELPDFSANLVLHLLSFQLLLLFMPFSHLMHSGGIFFARRFLASPDTFSGDVE